MKTLALVLFVACSSSKTDDKSSPKGEPAKPAGGAKADKPTITGELVVSGAMAGTFQWKSDLALDCTWIPATKVGRVEVTMTDGHEAFLAFDALVGSDNAAVTMTSGKLKSPARLTSKSGYTLVGTDDGKVTTTVDTDLESKDGTKVHIKGTLEASCQTF